MELSPKNPLYPIVEYQANLEQQLADTQQQLSEVQQQVMQTTQQAAQAAQQAADLQKEAQQIQAQLQSEQAARQALEGKDNRAPWERVAEKLLDAATRDEFLRLPYKLGAEWMHNQAFDCSSWVLNLFLYLGYTQTFGDAPGVPRGANAQLKRGLLVQFEDLRPGDVIGYNFDTDPAEDHIAIYKGDGKIIQTNTPATGINEQDINTWNRNALNVCRRWIGDNGEQLVAIM